MNEQLFATKLEFFTDIQIWPTRARFDPQSWLENFEHNERSLAIHLLHHVYFLSSDMLKAMFKSVLQLASMAVVRNSIKLDEARACWRRHVDKSYFTMPTGETSSPADSGYIFMRMARDVAGIDEEQCLEPATLSTRLDKFQPNSGRHVYICDDFCGTGKQFLKTWQRQNHTDGGSYTLEKAAIDRKATFTFIPLVATKYGIEQIRASSNAPVNIIPAHLLDSSYSVFDEHSRIWRGGLQQKGIDMLRNVSTRFGLPDRGGYDEMDWKGFHALGLTLIFDHHAPDATLPLLRAVDVQGLKPLFRRD